MWSGNVIGTFRGNSVSEIMDGVEGGDEMLDKCEIGDIGRDSR